VYYVVFFELQFELLEEAFARCPEEIRAHVARTRQLHTRTRISADGRCVRVATW
jgi:hypothetical protein